MFALPFFLALLLAVSAAHKLFAHERLGIAAAKLVGVQPAFGPVFSFGAAALETVAAISLLSAESRLIGCAIAALLWTTYAALLARRIGRRLDCGCSFGRGEKPITLGIASRAAGLAVIAVVAGILPSAPFAIQSLFAAAGFLVLYLALDELLAIPEPEWRHG